MERYAVIEKPDPISAGVRRKIETALNQEGYIEDQEHPDTVFVAGGDGTFIYAVHKYMDQLDRVRFYGIHTGTLGFYTDYKDSDLDAFLNVYRSGTGREVRYPILEIEDDRETHFAINEMRIENAARTQQMKISIDGREFETYRGTGICLATQWGSTGYNRSIGGAVVQEGIDILQMSEIAGIHHRAFRSLGSPLIMSGDSVVDFESDSFEGALLGADSDVYEMHDIRHVTVRICRKLQVRMLRGRDVSYFDRLKSLF